MSEARSSITPRRAFLKTTGRVAAAATLVGSAIPRVHAAENNTIQVALIGCGGRGTGAASNALSTPNGPMKLVALADVFEQRVRNSYSALSDRHGEKVDVPEERRFSGFDAYKRAMDCLNPGDLVLLATPPCFRWPHFTYAVEKGIHVFMEKPVTVDGPTSRRMLELAKKADEKNLKAGVGLMVRHCEGRKELYRRIRDGEIGDIVSMRAYRLGGRAAAVGPRPDNISELRYQVQRFHSFLWSGGGIFSDYNIHQVDECSWMKDAWPVSAHALGGRHYREGALDQNLDTYSIEYTYPDGTKFYFFGRHMDGCHNEFASYVHGAKGAAIVSTSAHTPGRVRTFSGHNLGSDNVIWAFPQPEPNPYQLEIDNLVAAIREDTPFNEVERGTIASLVTAMGRMAAHTGRIITYDEILDHDHEFAPGVGDLTEDSPAPLELDAEGQYPIPAPGRKADREY